MFIFHKNMFITLVGKAVKINKVQVPKKYELSHDGNDTIILECDFTVDSTDTGERFLFISKTVDLILKFLGFVLKWLHNNVQIVSNLKKIPKY